MPRGEAKISRESTQQDAEISPKRSDKDDRIAEDAMEARCDLCFVMLVSLGVEARERALNRMNRSVPWPLGTSVRGCEQ